MQKIVIIGGCAEHAEALRKMIQEAREKGLLVELPPRQLYKSFSPNFTIELHEPAPIKPEQHIERSPRRGAFDCTGASPGATLNKKRKWWER